MEGSHYIRVGQRLRLPKRVWRQTDRVRQQHKSPYIRKMPKRRERQPRRTCDPVIHAPSTWAVSGAGFSWPVDGVVLTGYGSFEGRKHEGLAIGAPLGTPVWASQAGQVIIAAHQQGYGELVVVRHVDGQLTLYGSLFRRCVTPGRTVRRGQMVGLVGASGGGASPRLYFELRDAGQKASKPLACFALMG